MGNYEMPPQASQFAGPLDSLYGFLVWASFISCVLVIGAMLYFAVKYKRRSENDKTAYISHNAMLEFLWSFIPFVIFMVVFGWGWKIFHDMRTMPEKAFEVHVVGQKWDWQFVYKSGKTSSGVAYVPVNEPVKLIISSRDVLHSVFVPGFRIKQDAVPGRYTALHFTANKVGSYQMFCTEYCGTGHSNMLAKINVVPREEFEQWLENDPYKGMSLVEIGKSVFARCLACHTDTEQPGAIGPGLAKVFGHDVLLADGTTVKADENYLRESILDPQAKIVAGYEGKVMTSFQGQLTEQELLGVIEYIKSLQ